MLTYLWTSTALDTFLPAVGWLQVTTGQTTVAATLVINHAIGTVDGWNIANMFIIIIIKI